MRLTRGNDLLLLLGVWTALFTLVSQPLGRALAYAYEIDQSQGLQLLPALVILAVVFTFHQVRKRHEARAEGLISAAAERARRPHAWSRWSGWWTLDRCSGSR